LRSRGVTLEPFEAGRRSLLYDTLNATSDPECSDRQLSGRAGTLDGSSSDRST